MEHGNFGQKDYDPEAQGFDARRGQEFSRAAGHIVTMGQSGEARPHTRNQAIRAPESVIDAALGAGKEEAPEASGQIETRSSAWHNYHVDKLTGNVVDDESAMGQAFAQERQPEQNMAGGRSGASDNSFQQDNTTTAAQVPQPVQAISSGVDADATSSNTQNSTADASIPASGLAFKAAVNYSQPSIPTSQVGPNRQLPQTPYSSYPSLPKPKDEPMLQSGPSMHADSQHLLSKPHRSWVSIFKSPWLWLAVGILMIIYFARG